MRGKEIQVNQVKRREPPSNSDTSDDNTEIKTTLLEMALEEHIEVEKNEDKSPQLWVDMIKRNRLPVNGIEITYTTPRVINGEIEVQIEERDVASGKYFWKKVLIMYVIYVINFP